VFVLRPSVRVVFFCFWVFLFLFFGAPLSICLFFWIYRAFDFCVLGLLFAFLFLCVLILSRFFCNFCVCWFV
jgi:hypothetical protein